MTVKEAVACMQYLYENRNGILFKCLVDKEDREIASESIRMGVEALCKQEKMRKMDPCDVCSYSPPSSMDGKPCALCPATARDDEEDADEMMTIADILMAIKSCEDRIKHLQSTPRHHHGKRKHERQVYLETIKLEALSLYLESLQEG